MIAGGAYIIIHQTPHADTKLTSTLVDTANWKTYANTTYGFEIQLPKDWQSPVNNDNQVFFDSTEQFNATTEHNKSRINSGGMPHNLIISYYSDIATAFSDEAKSSSGTKTPHNLEEYIGYNQDVRDLRKINFAGQDAYKGREIGMFDTDVIWLQKGNHLYIFSSIPDTGMSSKLSDQIISTFKFTQNTTTTTPVSANWKIYSNAKYAFEFKYPLNWYIVGQSSLVNHDAQLLSNYVNANTFSLENTPNDLKNIFFEVITVNSTSTLNDLKPKSDKYFQLIKFDKFITNQGVEGREVIVHSSDMPVGNHTSILFS